MHWPSNPPIAYINVLLRSHTCLSCLLAPNCIVFNLLYHFHFKYDKSLQSCVLQDRKLHFMYPFSILLGHRIKFLIIHLRLIIFWLSIKPAWGDMIPGSVDWTVKISCLFLCRTQSCRKTSRETLNCVMERRVFWLWRRTPSSVLTPPKPSLSAIRVW